MKTIKERMLIVWNDDGSFRGAHLDERIEYEDGGTRNTQRPLSQADADALIGKVDANTIAQLDAAKASIIELGKEHETKTQQLTAEHETKLAEIAADRDAKLAELAADREAKLAEAQTKAQQDTAERDSIIQQITAERNELKAKLDQLKPPHDPRYIKPDAWYARMTLDNVTKLFTLSETDKVAKQFIGSFAAVKGENRPMWLDHPSAQQGIAYLTAKGVFTAEEAAKMLADSTEAEAI